ncbi:ABC transporter ATP-binding protein [Pseudorhodoferax soli]|uniref:Branched-chain amino acid transport system ATP-binding protein n=1 Tax=Pseudorhodoferax soli TaxID=545864 RepID=A0A368XQH3_9BURK|nr:ABC transporter ATP-binding protein [Pseudorhodoferax soli]RCW69406.1 branched-chain amino acid transport system ATP-binding protein [Pseudorhodoferax soli]
MTSTAIAIACTGVSVRFGDFVALSNVGLDVATGQTLALIGPNGAGKTTLLNALSGRLALSGGRVQLQGRDITAEPIHRRARLGLGRSFQIINIFPEMTVLENLRLGAQPMVFGLQPFWRGVQAWPGLEARAREVAALVGLDDALDMPAAVLSHGRQRAVELGLALMSDPPVLLLDEPLAGVGQAEIQATTALIERVRQNRTVLLVEHNMDVVMRVADEVVVMMAGEILTRGTPEQVRADARVRRAYLGGARTQPAQEAAHA